jgi:hypothetical protein
MSWNLNCQVCSEDFRLTDMKFCLAKKEVEPNIWHTVWLCISCLIDREKDGWAEDLDNSSKEQKKKRVS